jgi:hypothetical protein
LECKIMEIAFVLVFLIGMVAVVIVGSPPREG